MKLRDAVKRAEAVLDKLPVEDRLAIMALVTMGKRLLRARRALKVVMRAVSDEEHLNQTELPFSSSEEPET
jgi:hypothetical protein